MSINYQKLDRYKGSLYGSVRYNGLEYDWETPDNQVIGSPGGVSGIHHHYTKGMYSQASSHSDIYGGEPPAYPYGEYGNLYQAGHSAPYYMGAFQQPREQRSQDGRDHFAPGMEEKKTSDLSMELIPPPDTTSVVDISPDKMSNEHFQGNAKPKRITIIPNAWAIFFLLFLLWTALAFLTYSGEKFIRSTFHGGKELNWKWYLFYAIIFTIIFAITSFYLDVSLISLEE